MHPIKFNEKIGKLVLPGLTHKSKVFVAKMPMPPRKSVRYLTAGRFGPCFAAAFALVAVMKCGTALARDRVGNFGRDAETLGLDRLQLAGGFGRPAIASPEARPVSAGIWTVLIDRRGLQGGNFQVLCLDRVRESLGAQAGAAIATLKDRGPLPSWLQFDARLCKFTAKDMPAQALPLAAVVRNSHYQVDIVFSAAPQAHSAHQPMKTPQNP